MASREEPTRGGHAPSVSLVITSRNRADLLGQALDSTTRLDAARFDLEVIVVNDGSTDDTASVAARYPVRLYNSNGKGVQAARDLGLQMATGSFVMFLDDDDVLLPRAIGAQLDEFERHPEYGAVHGQYELVDHDMRSLRMTVPAPPLTSGWILPELLSYPPQIATVLTRTDVAREVGPFDRALPGGEDWDWILRTAHRYPIGRVARPVMQFRMRPEPDEDLERHRFPALVTIFRRHTRGLGLVEQARLRPRLWHQRGLFASRFVEYAGHNWARGRRDRCLLSLVFAFRCSPPHALASIGRAAVRRTDVRGDADRGR